MVGRTIRRLRLDRGLTQEQLVRGLYDRSYLSLIERGKITPSGEALRLFASRLGVDVSDLETSNRDVLREARTMFQDGRTLRNSQLLARAWLGFRQCGSVSDMISCATEWAKTVSNGDVLHALNDTLKSAIFDSAHREIIVELRILLGNCYFGMAQNKQAAWVYRDILNDHPPAQFLGRLHVNIGSALMELQDYEQAMQSYSTALKLCHNDRRKIRTYLGIGRCYRYLREPKKAMECFHMVAQWANSTGDTHLYMLAKHCIGAVHLDELHITQALRIFDDIIVYYRESNMVVQQVELIEEFVRASFYQQRMQDALRWCAYGIELLVASNNHMGGRFLIWRGRIYAYMGEWDRSRDATEAAKIVLGDLYEKTVTLINPFI